MSCQTIEPHTFAALILQVLQVCQRNLLLVSTLLKLVSTLFIQGKLLRQQYPSRLEEI